mgnify:CR=1 FL=1
MSFPLGSLQADGTATVAAASALGTPSMGARRQIGLALGFVGCCLLLLSLASYHAGDAAFTTSGQGEPTRNLAGTVGAWLADGLFFAFGWSAWWLVPVSWRAWLSGLAAALRRELSRPGYRPAPTASARRRRTACTR